MSQKRGEEAALPFLSTSPVPEPVVWSEQELARQRVLSQQLCEPLGGVLPLEELPLELREIERVLDAGCGAGGWAMTLAETFPRMQVYGVDIDGSCIELAQRLALARGLSNARFEVADVRTMTAGRFSLAGFDLVNVAFLAEALFEIDYVALMSHITRLCRPGGIVRWTEMELPITTSAAFERLMALTCRALQQAGQGFISSQMWAIAAMLDAARVARGEQPLAYERRHLGITIMMGGWLRKTGWQNIGQTVHALEVSAHLPLWEAFFQQSLIFARRVTPFLLHQQVASSDELAALTRQLQTELRHPRFCGIYYVMTVVGQKPDA